MAIKTGRNPSTENIRRSGKALLGLNLSPAQEKLPAKSIWKKANRDSWAFFCPNCRAARKMPFRSRPGGIKQISQVLLTALVFTLATWPIFEWKGILCFVPFWAVFEVYYRYRMRGVLACPHCGFDPYLYLNDVQSARNEIESHWRKKFAERGIPYPGDAPAVAEGAAPPAEGAPVAAEEATPQDTAPPPTA
jgi:hypothetical protein